MRRLVELSESLLRKQVYERGKGPESARKFRRGTRAPWLPDHAWGGLEKATAPGGAVRVAFDTKAAL